MLVLGLETSCDDTSVALVRDGREILANLVSSQIEAHAVYGGVVPELASRAHTELLTPLIDAALAEAKVGFAAIDAVAVTQGPGLLGALLVGVTAAQALGWALDVPVVGVNHLEAHLFANFLVDPDLKPPVLALLVSGGHTALVIMEDFGHYRLVGQTVDDAAGEAFDKVARMIGLPYPGGPPIDNLAPSGNARAFDFPQARLTNPYDFSFSGLKTAVLYTVQKLPQPLPVADLAASFQRAAVGALVKKTARAAADLGMETVILAGGVASNRELRARLAETLAKQGARLVVPPPGLCSDNAAMIAARGYHQLLG
ncbi:MAG: tRNA (adenosine(37)-N6)-threonylcarbamoyltransferase complex transferase subunit TsaD, partial [Candidatus Sericytochromatia bacterium]|nr:tRNA (adenosine(37)-N6)-threonylcarbamoyltransferase complex transferase subunit TsaD [Candidatus Sericytochromatia bacterium]